MNFHFTCFVMGLVFAQNKDRVYRVEILTSFKPGVPFMGHRR